MATMRKLSIRAAPSLERRFRELLERIRDERRRQDYSMSDFFREAVAEMEKRYPSEEDAPRKKGQKT